MNILSLFDDTEDLEPVAAGTTIFARGDTGDRMYVVIDGRVGITADGTSHAEVGPGELFGEMSLIDDMPRSADAVAITDCVVAPLDERQFLFLVHEKPMFALHVMSVMADRLRAEL